MNICFISNEFPPETGWGGRSTYMYILAHGLVNHGHKVHVISQAIDGEKSYRDGDVWIHRVSPKSLKLPPGRIFYDRICGATIHHLEYSYAIFLKLKEILIKTQIDIAEAGETRAESYYVVRSGIVPLVVKLHTPSFLLRTINKDPVNIDRFLWEWFEKFTIKNCAAITSCSASLASIVAKKYRMPLRRIKVINNPVDMNIFVPKNGDNYDKTVLYCGRLEIRKGVHTLARAIPIILQKIPDVKFVFVGHNPTSPSQNIVKEELLNILQTKGIRGQVKFLDRIKRDQLIDYYQKCSVCVVPSVWENFPYTCLEPMSCAKAVVASRTGGIPEIIEDGISGLLFNPSDEKELAKKVTWLFERPDRLKTFGKNARVKIENSFHKDIIVKKTLDFYKRILKNMDIKFEKS